MVQILEYAASVPSVKPRKIIAPLALALFTLIYAWACWPAMNARGYPPMNHFWLGMVYLWVFFIPLYTLIEPLGKSSLLPLTLYALATAYIEGCTVVFMVPHRLNLLEGIPLIIYYGPIHVGVTFTVAGVISVMLRVLQIAPGMVPAEQAAGRAVARLGIAVVSLAAAIAFPYAFRSIAIARDFRTGAVTADAAWANHSACILCFGFATTTRQSGDYYVEDFFDINSGLPVRQQRGLYYEPGYKARIQQLLSLHGVPPWSRKQQLVSESDLLGILNSREMTPVPTYPYDVSPNATLMRHGDLQRWNGYYCNESNSVCLITPAGSCSTPDYAGDASIGRLAKYPGVVFVRGGDHWVAAVANDGAILSEATHK